jgi:hypothetical protein
MRKRQTKQVVQMMFVASIFLFGIASFMGPFVRHPNDADAASSADLLLNSYREMGELKVEVELESKLEVAAARDQTKEQQKGDSVKRYKEKSSTTIIRQSQSHNHTYHDLLDNDVPAAAAAATTAAAAGQNGNHGHELPKWVTNYITWHQEMRNQFPGRAIIEDPNAPKVLVRTCLGLCGGLHDRLGQLPTDLYIANQTQRLLLIKWIKPQPLESFLVPPPVGRGLDWTFPNGVSGWGTDCNGLNACAKQVRNQPKLMRRDENVTIPFDTFLTEQIHDLNHGPLKDTKAVTMTILHVYQENDPMDQRLRNLGETDMIYGTPSYGAIFHKFFQPHPNIQKQISQLQNQLNLVPGHYDVVHCRVRHPKAYENGKKFYDGTYVSNADKTGLPFEGDIRSSAIETAVRALQCARTIPDAGLDPIYFMSDSSDLVKYLAFDLKPEQDGSVGRSIDVDSKALALASQLHLVTREQSIPNAHIDKNKGRKDYEYYATFVDLYLGINARCVTLGVGNYAAFAAKISGTSCVIQYMEEMWGGKNRFDAAQSCSLSS